MELEKINKQGNTLTVGITTHGERALWLQDLISSLYFYNETVLFKTIVVDNASTDNTVSYLESISKELSIEFIHNNENVDDTIATNQILSRVNTEFYLKLDSDVIFTEHNSIIKAINTLSKNNYSVIGPYWDLSLRRKSEISDWTGYDVFKKLLKDADASAKNLNHHFEVTLKLPRGNFMLMKTAHIKQVGLFDEHYLHNAMEYPLIAKLIENGFDYGEFIDKSVIHKPDETERLLQRKRLQDAKIKIQSE